MEAFPSITLGCSILYLLVSAAAVLPNRQQLGPLSMRPNKEPEQVTRSEAVGKMDKMGPKRARSVEDRCPKETSSGTRTLSLRYATLSDEEPKLFLS